MLLILTVGLLAACGPAAETQTVSTTAQAGSSPNQREAPGDYDSKRYANRDSGFSIAVPRSFILHRDFHSSYLENDAWKSFAPSDSQGKPLLDMELKGSNKVTAAELRVGSSDQPRELARCLQAPATAVPAKTQKIMLDGVEFTRFEAADAGMGHFLQVQAYRAEHQRRCYAIDLLITGIHPQMFDPPRQPPFDKAAALRKLQQLLQTFEFLR